MLGETISLFSQTTTSRRPVRARYSRDGRTASLYPNLSGVSIFDNVSESTYDAMQLVFQRRYNAGLTFSTHYTLAHGQTLAPTAWDANRLEWADSALDIRHRWVVNTSYELPFGNGLTGIAAGFAKVGR